MPAKKTSVGVTTRRQFIQAGIALPMAAMLAGCGTTKPEPRRAFFSDSERRFIDAATARLIPSGESGGATEAAVGEFIDRQLAGAYGRADTWYMEGPWADGTEQQGYQSRHTPAELYRIAIHDLDDYCRSTFGDKSFVNLPAADQDKILTGLEHGKIKLARAPAKAFFTMLLQNTQEGFLADPMYGGNRDFTGWKLIGFPGPRYNYTDEITHYGAPYTLPTVGLLGRDGTRTLQG